MEQVGHLYPAAPGGGTVIAWLWARTVTCPNPACRATAPLVSSFWLSKKKGALTGSNPWTAGRRSVRFEVAKVRWPGASTQGGPWWHVPLRDLR